LDAPVVINETAVPAVPTLDLEWVTQGMVVYARECATCHGANLEGAPDWKESLPDGSFPPPPHDNSGHTWHHPDSLLLAIIADGGDPAYNSKMPAFRDKLTQQERRAVLEFIKSSWGRNEAEFQWWMTATQSGA
jgi:mono/diheme cytochrome c family protein